MIFTVLSTYFLMGPLVYSRVNFENSNEYTAIITASYGGLVLFFMIFGCAFVGFKGAQVYKDEVEDGTFLIILSKPQTRSKIIFCKWLAYATVNTIFLLFIIMSLTTAIMLYDQTVFDSNNLDVSTKHHIGLVIGVFFGLGLVLLFILSSIALLLSTKLSTGATVGVVITIGLAVQITGLIGQFATTQSHDNTFLNTNIKPQVRVVLSNGREEFAAQAAAKGKTEDEFETEFNQIIGAIYGAALSNQDIKLNDQITMPAGNLGYIAINTNAKPSFNYLSYIDLSYQLGLLANIATDTINSDQDLQNVAAIQGGMSNGPGSIKKQEYVSTYTPNTAKTEIADKMNQLIAGANQYLLPYFFNKQPTDPTAELLKLDWSWFIDFNDLQTAAAANEITVSKEILNEKDQNQKIQDYLFGNPNNPEWETVASSQKLDKIEYKDFINKYGVLITYSVVAVILVPVSYLVVRRQDFR